MMHSYLHGRVEVLEIRVFMFLERREPSLLEYLLDDILDENVKRKGGGGLFAIP